MCGQPFEPKPGSIADKCDRCRKAIPVDVLGAPAPRRTPEERDRELLYGASRKADPPSPVERGFGSREFNGLSIFAHVLLAASGLGALCSGVWLIGPDSGQQPAAAAGCIGSISLLCFACLCILAVRCFQLLLEIADRLARLEQRDKNVK